MNDNKYSEGILNKYKNVTISESGKVSGWPKNEKLAVRKEDQIIKIHSLIQKYNKLKKSDPAEKLERSNLSSAIAKAYFKLPNNPKKLRYLKESVKWIKRISSEYGMQRKITKEKSRLRQLGYEIKAFEFWYNKFGKRNSKYKQDIQDRNTKQILEKLKNESVEALKKINGDSNNTTNNKINLTTEHKKNKIVNNIQENNKHLINPHENKNIIKKKEANKKEFLEPIFKIPIIGTILYPIFIIPMLLVSIFIPVIVLIYIWLIWFINLITFGWLPNNNIGNRAKRSSLGSLKPILFILAVLMVLIPLVLNFF